MIRHLYNQLTIIRMIWLHNWSCWIGCTNDRLSCRIVHATFLLQNYEMFTKIIHIESIFLHLTKKTCFRCFLHDDLVLESVFVAFVLHVGDALDA